jgi:hypothetical protein
MEGITGGDGYRGIRKEPKQTERNDSSDAVRGPEEEALIMHNGKTVLKFK